MSSQELNIKAEASGYFPLAAKVGYGAFVNEKTKILKQKENRPTRLE